MDELGVDVLLLSVGADLPYLTGYEAMPLERLTMLVLPRDGDARLVVPRLEAPRVDAAARPVRDRAVGRDRRPVALVARLAGAAGARRRSATRPGRGSCSSLQDALPDDRRSCAASTVIGPLRMVKDARRDRGAAARAAHAVDAIAAEMRTRPFAGRTELDVHRELVERMLAARSRAGELRDRRRRRARGEPAPRAVAEPGDRRRRDRAVRLRRHDAAATAPTSRACSTSASRRARCATSTRCSPRPRRPACGPRPSARRARTSTRPRATVIADAGFGEYFVHRVGHGIGCDAHEDPYMVAGNDLPLEAGHAFSVEPGIYLPGRFGMRLEDIVVATARRAAASQRRRARPRGGRLSRHERGARRRNVPPAAGRGRPPVLLGDDAPPRGQPRLRLAAAQRLRRRSRSAGGAILLADGHAVAGCRRARVTAVAASVALGVSVVRRARRGARSRGAARRAQGARRRDGRHRRRADDGAVDDAPVGPSSRPRSTSSRRSSASSDCSRRPSSRAGRYALAAARLARRCGVPRRGERRDAPRPLVPRAARPATRRAEGARRPGPRSSGRSRSRCSCWPTGVVQMFTGAVDDGYDGLLALGLARVRGHDDRPRRADLVRAARALLLRRDGRDRPALPRDPHRLRHGPRPPRRPRPVTQVLATIGDRSGRLLSPKP